jgi:acetolactate synthase small subunit
VQHRHFDLQFSGHSDVLLRVVSLLRRRGCEIRSLSFSAGDPHREGRLEVTLDVRDRQATALPAWLANLVEITSVTER